MGKSNIKEFGLYLMIALISFLLLSTIGMCSSCTNEDICEKKDLNGTLIPNEDYIDWDYCKFYINYVVETDMSITADGDKVYWVVYDDIDAGFDNEIISTSEESFTLLLEALDALQNVKPYTHEWEEISSKYEFVILYKGKTNILMSVDKD